MTKLKKLSRKTQGALEVLHKKKIDAFAAMILLASSATLSSLVIFFVRAMLGETCWAFFFEFNGVTLSTLGALWTALGVRVTSTEHKALLSINTHLNVVLTEIIDSLATASRFATFGAFCIFVGGIFLCIKIGFLH